MTDGVDMNIAIIDRRTKKKNQKTTTTQSSKTDNKDYSWVVLINGLILLVHDMIWVWRLLL